MLNVSRTVSYEITLSLLKIESLVFSDIVHGDSGPWYLVTEKKQTWRPELGPKSSLKLSFLVIFSSLVHVLLEFAYNDSLQ